MSPIPLIASTITRIQVLASCTGDVNWNHKSVQEGLGSEATCPYGRPPTRWEGSAVNRGAKNDLK